MIDCNLKGDEKGCNLIIPPIENLRLYLRIHATGPEQNVRSSPLYRGDNWGVLCHMKQNMYNLPHAPFAADQLGVQGDEPP